MTISLFEIQAQGYNIPCKLFSPDSEPELVVIGVHGFAGDKESSVIATLAETLCERNSALICFDFPAHGESNADDSFLRVNNCRNDLMNVKEFVKNKFPKSRYGIFATSFGGYITLLSISELKDCKIVLRAPGVTIEKSFLEKIIPVSKEEFFENGGAVCGFERKMFVSSEFYKDLSENPIGNISQPMMIIQGTDDDIVPYNDIKSFCKKNDKIKLVSVDGADHRFKNEGDLKIIIDSAMEWFF